MNTIDTTKAGATLVKTVCKLPNVDLKLNSTVNGYDINPANNHVRSVKVGKESIDCDYVVIANGAYAVQHVWDHFNSVLPGIHG